MDSDLAESVKALAAIFDKRLMVATFAPAQPVLVDGLCQRLGLPERYASFLREANPIDVETVTPSERVRLIPAAELEAEQIGYGTGDAERSAKSGWRKEWIVIGQGMLGDPYFLDSTKGDAEGDCPVMTAMNGADLKPVMCASSFASFVSILAAAMELAEGFADDGLDPDDEAIFREALSPKIRVIDQAALRSGHWTS